MTDLDKARGRIAEAVAQEREAHIKELGFLSEQVLHHSTMWVHLQLEKLIAAIRARGNASVKPEKPRDADAELTEAVQRLGKRYNWDLSQFFADAAKE